jgi:tetratricopeptide (TPR) repeat protein
MSIHLEVSDRLLRFVVSMVKHGHRRRFIFASLLIIFCVGLSWSFGQSTGKQDATDGVGAQEFYQTGLSLVRQGQFDEGILALKKGLDNDPRNLLMLDAIGAAYSIQGDSVEAERYFSKALGIDPTFTAARKNLAITLFTAGQYDEAGMQFEKLKSGPADSRSVASLFLGMLAGKKQEYSRSVTLLRESRELLEQYPEGVLSLSRALYKLHRENEAKAALLNLYNVPGVSATEYFDAGVLFSQLGDDQQALSAFDRAEGSKNTIESLEYKRAEAFARLGRQQDALNLLTRIAADKPNSAALNHLAHVAQESHQYDLAIQSLRLAAKLDPKNEDNYLQFSTICSDAGKYSEALQAADLGLQNNPNSYRLLVQKAAVLDNMGLRADAEQILKTAVGLKSDNSEALLSLAIVQANANEPTAAADTLRSAIKKFPGNFYMRYWLGYVLAQTEESGAANISSEHEAEQAFRAAIWLKPSFADSYYQLSRLYMHTDQKMAEQNLAACLRADPNYGPAQYALAQIYLKTGRRAEGQKLYAQFKKQQTTSKPNGPDSEEPVQR